MKKKKKQPKFWGNSLLKKQLIGNLWSLPEFPYISKWPKVLFSERVWTDTKEIRPEELWLKESLASGMCQNLDSIPCRAMEISVALAGTHEPPPYWSSPCSQAPNAEDYTSLLWSLTGRGDTSNRVEKHVKRIMHETASAGTIPTVFLNQCQVFWHFFLFLPLPPSHRSRR